MKVLVVAAHPDDEILGCGGALLKHKDLGHDIDICIVTHGYEPLCSKEYIETKICEATKVDKLLGTNARYSGLFPTVKLNTFSTMELNTKIGDVIKKSNPDIIYTHFENDINADHGIVFNSVMVNTRPIDKKIKVYCFETLSSTEWSNKPFMPNLYVDIEKYINVKTELFSIYESEVKKYPHPRSIKGIEILASKRGMDVCLKYAEAFQIIKDYWC